MPTQKTAAAPSDPSAAFVQNQPFPTPAHQSTLLPPLLAAQDPVSNQRHQAPGLLPAPFVLHPSPVFQAVVPRSDPHLASSPLMVPPAGSEPRAAPTASATPSAAPTAYLGQDILGTLKPAAPVVGSDMHKPILAPNFLPSTLFPPHSFQEPMGGNPLLQHSKELDVFPQPSNIIKPLSVSARWLFTDHHCSFSMVLFKNMLLRSPSATWTCFLRRWGSAFMLQQAVVWSTVQLPEFRSKQAKRGDVHHLFLQPVTFELITKCLVSKQHTQQHAACTKKIRNTLWASNKKNTFVL